MPSSFRLSYQKSRKSKAFAIKSMCAECSGYDRKVVRNCTDTGCPLWPHRPFQKGDPEEDSEPIEVKAKRKCCDDPQIEKGEDKKECLNCGKIWKKRK